MGFGVGSVLMGRLSDRFGIVWPVAGGAISLWWRTRSEWEGLLEIAGLEVEALYGWFDRRPFDESSEEFVWVARKLDPRAQIIKKVADDVFAPDPETMWRSVLRRVRGTLSCVQTLYCDVAVGEHANLGSDVERLADDSFGIE